MLEGIAVFAIGSLLALAGRHFLAGIHQSQVETAIFELDPTPLVGDATRAREQLGWEPRTSFEEMIGAMVEHDLAELRATRPAASSPLG